MKDRVAYPVVEVENGERRISPPCSLHGYMRGAMDLWKSIERDGGFFDDNTFYPAHRVLRFELEWMDVEE